MRVPSRYSDYLNPDGTPKFDFKKDLKDAKELYKLYAEDAGKNELKSQIDKVTNWNQLDPIAGELQQYHVTKNPKVASDYGFRAPVTQTGIEWLNKNTGSTFNTNTGYYRQDAKTKADLDKYIQSLPNHQKEAYGLANFNDKRAFFRMPLYTTQAFNLDNPLELNTYNDTQENIYDPNKVKESSWSKANDNISLYTQPITYQTREFDTDEEYQKWLKQNPKSSTYDNKTYQQTGDYNFTTPIFNFKSSTPESPTPPPVTPTEEPKTPLDLKTPEEPVKETATPVGNQEPPGADFDYSPQMRANLLNLMGNLFANRSNRGTYTPFKLPTQSLMRPVDQAAMTNSMMNNVYSNNAFQTANRNLPSSVQQSFLNQATGNMFKNLPVEGVTKYYNDFSNNQINAHNQFMNNLYGQEKFLWDDQRKAMDQIRRGYALAGNARLNALGKYFNANAKLETETPWAFIQAGMKPVRLGDGKWRGLYDKSTQELQRRVMDWEQKFGNKDFENMSQKELVEYIKSLKNKS